MNATFNIRNLRHARLRRKAAKRICERLWKGLPKPPTRISGPSPDPHEYPWPSRAFIDCSTRRLILQFPMEARKHLNQRKKDIETWIKDPV
jgi:hypothetical protein